MGLLSTLRWTTTTVLIGTGLTIPVILYAMAFKGPSEELVNQLLFYGVPSLILVGFIWFFRKTLHSPDWKAQDTPSGKGQGPVFP